MAEHAGSVVITITADDSGLLRALARAKALFAELEAKQARLASLGAKMGEVGRAGAVAGELSRVSAAAATATVGVEKLHSSLRRLASTSAMPTVGVRDIATPRLLVLSSLLGKLGSRSISIGVELAKEAGEFAGKALRFATSPLGLLGLGGGLAGVTAALWYPTKLAAEMERLRMGVETFSSGPEEAAQNFKRLLDYAVKSPLYETPFVIEMGGKLLSTGQDINFAMRALDAFARAAYYTGASLEELKLSFRGFTQIASKGVLQAEELHQVTENLGVPINVVLKKLGVAGDELDKLGKLGITAEKAMRGIVEAFEEHYKAPDYTKDLLAQLSQIRESARMLAWEFGKGMLPSALRIAKDIADAIDPAGAKYQDFAARLQALGAQAGAALESAYARIKEFVDRMVTALQADEEFQRLDWGGRIIYLLDVAARVAAPYAVEAGKYIGSTFGRGMLEGFASAIAEDPILRLALSALVGSRVPGGPLVKIAASVGTYMAITGFSDIREHYRRIREEIPQGYITRPAPFSLPSDVVGKSLPATRMGEFKMFEYQRGGIVTRPHLGIVGEAGPEAIIPLSARMRSRALELWRWVGIILGATLEPPELAGEILNRNFTVVQRVLGTSPFVSPAAVSAVATVPGLTLAPRLMVSAPSPEAVPRAAAGTTVNIYLDNALQATFNMAGQSPEEIAEIAGEELARSVAAILVSELRRSLMNRA